MKGRLISVVWAEDSSIFAFSAASLQPLQRELVGAQVDAFLLLELVGQIFDDLAVEIFAAEEGVAVGRLHFEHAVADLEDRDVERAAAKVIDRDGLAVVLVEAIGERGRGRLVDDAQHFKAGDLAGVLGRLALRVVEVGRNGDHRLRHGLAEIALGGFLHLLQDEGGNLRRANNLRRRP